MPIIPEIPKPKLSLKKCGQCGTQLTSNDFTQTHSIFYEDGLLPICDECVTDFLESHNWEWKWIDKICQWADIPFIVKEWTRIEELCEKKDLWHVYAKTFIGQEYKNLGWVDYNNQYIKLREVGMIEEELPLIREKRYTQLRRKWGGNYDDEDLNYLEDLYKGLLVSQNVNGALQIDQAQKICKFSLEIDKKIRAGDKDVDKFISSYDKLVKTAEFTPKNAKNATDFDSFAEVALWLEKRGRQNKFYDNVTRDIIDETLKNIQNYNQRLYVNEGGIGEEITERLEALKNANKLEQTSDYYDLPTELNLDEYDNLGFENDEFEALEDESDDRAY